jgi:hypothetical protein
VSSSTETTTEDRDTHGHQSDRVAIAEGMRRHETLPDPEKKRCRFLTDVSPEPRHFREKPLTVLSDLSDHGTLSTICMCQVGSAGERIGDHGHQ